MPLMYMRNIKRSSVEPCEIPCATPVFGSTVVELVRYLQFDNKLLDHLRLPKDSWATNPIVAHGKVEF